MLLAVQHGPQAPELLLREAPCQQKAQAQKQKAQVRKQKAQAQKQRAQAQTFLNGSSRDIYQTAIYAEQHL